MFSPEHFQADTDNALAFKEQALARTFDSKTGGHMAVFVSPSPAARGADVSLPNTLTLSEEVRQRYMPTGCNYMGRAAKVEVVEAMRNAKNNTDEEAAKRGTSYVVGYHENARPNLQKWVTTGKWRPEPAEVGDPNLQKWMKVATQGKSHVVGYHKNARPQLQKWATMPAAMPTPAPRNLNATPLKSKTVATKHVTADGILSVQKLDATATAAPMEVDGEEDVSNWSFSSAASTADMEKDHIEDMEKMEGPVPQDMEKMEGPVPASTADMEKMEGPVPQVVDFFPAANKLTVKEH